MAIPNYKKMEKNFVVEGLPEGVCVKKPGKYTREDLIKIIDSKLTIR